ncbi:MAG: diguanylate cyclase, partial [Pseudomonadota bacterium]
MLCDEPSHCPYPIPEDEAGRLHELSLYGPPDGLRDPIFERITRLVSGVFDCPTALVSLVAEHKQFFAARVGIDAEETSRDVSFCAHAIANRTMLVVPDATKDERFKNNALVTGPPGIRFYAGAPLVSPGGHGLGSLCVIDYKPRADFTGPKPAILRELADVVVERLNSRRAEVAQEADRRRFTGVTNTSPDCILCLDGEGVVRYANDAALAAFGRCVPSAVADIIPTWPAVLRDLVTPSSDSRDGARPGAKTATVEVKQANGRAFPAEISISRWHDPDGANYGLILRDVSEKHAFQAKLERMAWFDELTGLPNRNSMLARLQSIFSAQKAASLVLLDIDGFKQVNDALGHNCGDAILRQAADRLTHCAPDAALVARLGGDEFCFVVERDLDPAAADRFVRGVQNCFTDEFVLEREPIHVGVSIGVAATPRDAETPEDLFSAAELALYEAKNSGRSRASVFRQELRDAAIARRTMECELQRAFKDGEFEVFYQPQVTMADNTIVGAEALIRWRHPERGLLTPSE